MNMWFHYMIRFKLKAVILLIVHFLIAISYFINRQNYSINFFSITCFIKTVKIKEANRAPELLKHNVVYKKLP